MNRFIISGNLTRDVESSTTANGKSMARFSVAVKKDYTTEGQAECDFFNVVAWSSLADICYKYLKKGSRVIVDGKMQTRTYETKDNEKRTVYELNATNVEFVSGIKTVEGQSTIENKNETQFAPIEDDDLPF